MKQSAWQALHMPFEAQVARTPDATAIELDGVRATYRELNGRANRLAHRLRSLGIGPGVPVVVCLERSLHYLVGMLGILKAGGVYVPLDPAYPPERLRLIVSDTRAPLVLAPESLQAALSLPDVRCLCPDAEWETSAGADERNPASAIELEHLAYIIFTSGSTGRPKGVCISHGAAVAHCTTMRRIWGLDGGDRVLAFASFTFDASVEQILPTLYAGATLVLRGATGWEVSEFSRRARQARLSVADLPTAFWDQWTQGWAAGEDGVFPADLRLVIIGGEAARAESVHRWQQTPLRSIRLVNAYGPTEATVSATIFEIPPSPPDGKPLERIPIGRPLPNRTVHLLDPRGAPVPAGTPGELHIGGDCLAHGYLHHPDLTAEKFIADPFSDRLGARLYRTGDLARALPDGTIEYLGRIDQQVKIRGYRIELGEIEEQIARHPAVREAVVVAREDRPGDKRLVAYVVRQMGRSLSGAVLRAFLQERLLAYMLPAAYVFLDRLPTTHTGKIDRHALPAPDSTRADRDTAYAPPRTLPERRLAAIWSRILGVDHVGIHDAFLDLGGDSLLAMQVVSQAAREGLRLAAPDLLTGRTIEDLAATAAIAAVVAADQGPVTGPVPLMPGLLRYLAAPRRLAHGGIASLAFVPRQDIEPALLEQAIRCVIAHHDALRLRFHPGESGWTAQHAAAEENQVVHLLGVSRHAPADRAAVVDATLDELRAGMDIGTGPLLRAVLIERGDGTPGRLVLLIHHIVMDAFSEDLLLHDLDLAYRQLRAGRQPELPPKTTSFKEWARRLAAHARSADLQRELPYWSGMLRNAPPPLPAECPAGSDRLGHIRHLTINLGRDETGALLRAAPALSAQVQDILLAALAQAFDEWTGSGRLLIRLIGHGRETPFTDLDLSRTIGWLTCAYPVLLDVRGTARPVAAVRAVREALQRVPNRGMGYGLLRHLGPETAVAALARLPQPEVHLNYLGRVGQIAEEYALFGSGADLPNGTQNQPVTVSPDIRLRGRVQDGRLHLRFAYHEHAYRESTLERVAEAAVAAMRAIIDAAALSRWWALRERPVHCG